MVDPNVRVGYKAYDHALLSFYAACFKMNGFNLYIYGWANV